METVQDLLDALTPVQALAVASGLATVAENTARAAQALADPAQRSESILQWLVWQCVARAALDTASQQLDRWVPDAGHWADLQEVARAQAVILLEEIYARLGEQPS